MEFHKICDFKAPTITLYQIKDGDCIGGYTEVQWLSNRTQSKADKNAMLFNATSRRKFPSKNTGKDIWCSLEMGPSFGSGGYDNDLE